MINKIYKKIILGLAIFPYWVMAEGITINFGDMNPLKNIDNIWELIPAILDFVVKVGAAIVVFLVIYSGFLFVTAQGSDEKITKAKKYFFAVIIGALLILGAQVLSVVICNTAGGLGAEVDCSFLK